MRRRPPPRPRRSRPRRTPQRPSSRSAAQEGRGGGQRRSGPGGGRRPERRRRPSAAQKHRNAFYAKLSELRRQDEAEQEAPAGEEPAAQAEGAEAGAPQAEAQPQPEAPPQPQQPAARQPLPGRAQARLRAAVERVGGDDAVREALAPKERPDGQTMKWSAVCCDAAFGLSPGDPGFTAWARLAVTPVREIKGLVDPRGERDGRGRRGQRRSGQGQGQGGGGGGRPWRDRQGGDYVGSEEMRQHGRDGSLTTRIRIIDMSKDRDR